MDIAELVVPQPVAPGRRAAPARRAARELLLVATLFLLYKLARMAVAGRVSTALANGESIWHLERLFHLPDEAAVQHPLLANDLVAHLANGYYAYVHFPATVITLVWLYLRHPAHYLWTRRVLACLTAAALALHLLVPLAPPRLTALTGLVDTGRRFGPTVYGPPDTDTLSNQYAAMPSLHVGWALAVAVALVAVTRGRLRWLWLAHPLVTLLVVVATGNHYWLDGVVVALMLGVVHLLLPTPVERPDPDGPRMARRVRGYDKTPARAWLGQGPGRRATHSVRRCGHPGHRHSPTSAHERHRPVASTPPNATVPSCDA